MHYIPFTLKNPPLQHRPVQLKKQLRQNFNIKYVTKP